MRRMYSEEQVKKLALEGLVGQDVVVKSLTSDGGEIIEGMSWYSFIEKVVENVTNTIAYAGVVKTGNKITFAIAGTLVLTANKTRMDIGEFVIPSTIGSKLYPIISNVVSLGSIILNTSETAQQFNPTNVVKDSNTNIRIQVRGTVSTGTYYYRYEETFLLSDSLVE